ncbi:MAG: proton-conducting transporter membrane subunit [Candidatus Natronoplasma sp.]
MTWETLVTTSPAFILSLPLLFAFLTTLSGRISKKLAELMFGIGLILTVLFVGVMSYQVLTYESWFYAFGAGESTPDTFFRITFLADGFAVLATITVVITALAAAIYSYSFMKGETGLNKFYTLFLLTLAGVNGMILTADLFNLFVWFEVTSVASCALVAFRNYKGKSVEAALKYMVLSTIGGLFILFSIALLYGQYGVLNYTLLADSIKGTFIDKLALGLLTVVLAMKASSVPMHMWAPDAYGEAPGSVTPFIAITSLGSLFVLFRLLFGVFSMTITPAVSGSVLIILGVLSMIVGVTMALVQSDLKRLIAYLSVSQVGYMMMAVGVGLATLNTGEYESFGSLAMRGGLFHMINDGVYKALLFLSAVAVVHVTDIRSLNELGGLAHKMPYTTFFFLFSALSIAGIPPLSGYSSKLLIYQSVYLYSPILAIIALVVSIITLAIIGKAFFNAFLGPNQGLAKGKVSQPMLLSMGALTAVLLIFTLFPNLVVNEIVTPAIDALIGGLIP